MSDSPDQSERTANARLFVRHAIDELEQARAEYRAIGRPVLARWCSLLLLSLRNLKDAPDAEYAEKVQP